MGRESQGLCWVPVWPRRFFWVLILSPFLDLSQFLLWVSPISSTVRSSALQSVGVGKRETRLRDKWWVLLGKSAVISKQPLLCEVHDQSCCLELLTLRAGVKCREQ